MHTWHWQTWQDLPYLTCDLLEPWAHGFFTQQFAPRYPRDLAEVLQPDVRVYRAKQVHGNTVLRANEVAPVSELTVGEASRLPLPEADGILTQQGQQSVWVCTADCTPALIGDRRTGQVAAVHAGWRGTAEQIVPEAIAQFQQQGSDLSDLRVALGPAIAGEVYQVSEAVAVRIGATVVDAQGDREILAQLQEIPNSPLLEDPQPGRVRLDVRRAIALQLEQVGLSVARIAIAPHCTYQQPEHFFSYRRNRQKNVQWSGIVSRGSFGGNGQRVTGRLKQRRDRIAPLNFTG
jgi:hypothetical protein